jgi:soluble lytic murein transglycosylase
VALTSFKISIVLVALAALPAAAAGTDADIVAARDAARAGNVKALEQLRARTAGHPLASYPAYWHLSATLERAAPEDIRAFLAKHADGPLADTLRRDWLKVLGNTGQWDLFRAEHPALLSEDPEVACHALQARILRDDAEARREARALFLAGREAPAACTAPFEAAAAERLVGSPEIWERIRKLLAANALKDARRANAMLPAKEQFNEKALERAGTEPSKYLPGEKSRIPTRATHELILYAIARLARSKPEDAAAQLEAHAPVLGADDTRYGFGQIAFAAAQSHHPRALEWYGRAGESPLTDAQLAWKVRSALRAGDWAAVRGAINVMSPEEARDPAWRYWLARSLAEGGARDAGVSLLAPLARERHFYGLLAAEDLGRVDRPDWTPNPPAEEDLARLRGIPAIQRAFALYRLELGPEAFREWVFGLKNMDDRGLLAASQLAAEAGLVDRSIGTADRTLARHDFSRRYPIPHREALVGAAQQFGVDEAMVYALIRQESRFNAEIKSRVGATGLMQLMPATARWVAKQIPVNAYRPALLTDPQTNVQMGTYYFRRVLTDLGDPVLATAGYNAGPGRARRWQDAKPLEGAIYAESIPFNETRDYVKKVMANAWFYRDRLTGQPASLRQLMGTVPGRNGANADAVAALP